MSMKIRRYKGLVGGILVVMCVLVLYEIRWTVFKDVTWDTNISNHEKGRLFCLVITFEKNHLTKAVAVSRTWGRRCDHTSFATNVPREPRFNITFAGITSSKKTDIVIRLFESLRLVYLNNSSVFDWFYIADDDTYAIIENLRSFLKNKNPEEDGYYGYLYGPTHLKYKDEKLAFAHGGPGIVLSKTTLKRFTFEGYINRTMGKCHPLLLKGGHDKHGDVNLGLCLLKLGVRITPFLDSKKRETFLKENPLHILNMMEDSTPEQHWFSYRDVIHHRQTKGEMLSPYAISFHYMSAGDMYFVDFLLYNLQRGQERPRDVFMLNMEYNGNTSKSA